MIAISDITAVLQRVWQAATAEGAPTQFPGVSLDAAGLACWFEFWVTQAHELPHRVPGTSSLRILIDVHCYSRHAAKRRIFEMTDTVRRTLAHQTFPLTAEEDEDLTLGALRIREATVRDLTRESGTEPRLPLQHLVVSLHAVAESSQR